MRLLFLARLYLAGYQSVRSCNIGTHVVKPASQTALESVSICSTSSPVWMQSSSKVLYIAINFILKGMDRQKNGYIDQGVVTNYRSYLLWDSLPRIPFFTWWRTWLTILSWVTSISSRWRGLWLAGSVSCLRLTNHSWLTGCWKKSRVNIENLNLTSIIPRPLPAAR